MHRKHNLALIITAIGLLLFGLFLLLYALVYPAEASDFQRDCMVITEIAWAGTDASSSAEWFELHNRCSYDVNTFDMSLVILREENEPTAIVVPSVTIVGGGYALFERTNDDRISPVADGVYTGGLPNTGVVAITLLDRSMLPVLEWRFDDGWPAGRSNPKASMSLLPDESGWYTSEAQYNGATDSEGNPVFGSPGDTNPEPDGVFETCVSGWPIRTDEPVLHFSESEVPYVHVNATYQDVTGASVDVYMHLSPNAVNSAWEAEWLDDDMGELTSQCMHALQAFTEQIEVGLSTGAPTGKDDELDRWLSGFYRLVGPLPGQPYRMYIPLTMSAEQ